MLAAMIQVALITMTAWNEDARKLTENVTVLVGPDNGAYPSGNSVVVQGAGETVIIDPSVTVVERGGAGVPVDAVINSHAHEDHLAGNGFFADAKIHIHHDDLIGAVSLDGLMDVYGLEGQPRTDFGQQVLDEFHYTPRPDAHGFSDGHVFDLGGVSLEAVHLPGHTRGHSGFRIDGGVFFLSDIDLTGFGPYYGDVWSSLEDFDESLRQIRDEEADWYVTFHHKGIIEGRDEFVERVDAFHAVIERRHAAMLDFLVEPRTIDEMMARRFVYRPHVEHVFADSVEHRTASLHIARMSERGEATEVEPGRWQVA
ncbi:MAG: glyoxylase-like metal-dependent hydrolase (beta-lactamase superfamily II) [Paracrocinitomix sp.]